MELKLNERELRQIMENVKKQVSRYVEAYICRMDEDTEEGVFLVEKDDLVEEIMSIEISFENIVQPKQ